MRAGAHCECAAWDLVLCAAWDLVLCGAWDLVLCSAWDLVLCGAWDLVLCGAWDLVLCSAWDLVPHGTCCCVAHPWKEAGVAGDVLRNRGRAVPCHACAHSIARLKAHAAPVVQAGKLLEVVGVPELYVLLAATCSLLLCSQRTQAREKGANLKNQRTKATTGSNAALSRNREQRSSAQPSMTCIPPPGNPLRAVMLRSAQP